MCVPPRSHPSTRPHQRGTSSHFKQVAVSGAAYPTHPGRRRGKLSGLSRHLYLARNNGSNATLSRSFMMEKLTETVVVVIDDDASVRAALKELIESVGVEVRLYPSANAFLEARIPDDMGCLVLDVRLPEMSGLKVQEKLSRAGVYVPIVFVTGHGDVAIAVRAMKAGAVDFLTKPFRSQDLLDAVFVALERDSARRKMQQLNSTIREHLESLSARERK